jgi:glycerate-2-kinase
MRAYAAMDFAAAGGLVMTGSTPTNVNDFRSALVDSA